MRRELPALLDLLRVAVEAGLPPAAALAEVGERASGPLARSGAPWGARCALGVPLGDALAELERRLPLPEVRRSWRRSNAPPATARRSADTLAAQARDARLRPAAPAQEEAARAGPKIQLVVALLLVPSVLLLVAAALAAALLGWREAWRWGLSAAGATRGRSPRAVSRGERCALVCNARLQSPPAHAIARATPRLHPTGAAAVTTSHRATARAIPLHERLSRPPSRRPSSANSDGKSGQMCCTVGASGVGCGTP